MPFANVTEIVKNEETAEMYDMIKNNPDAKKAAEKFDREYEFRKKLIAARKASGLTQTQLENVSGLKQQAISRIEKTGANTPSVSTVIKYLDSIGYQLDVAPKNVPG
jgi:DNA-binding XRE family transcriptional regulator